MSARRCSDCNAALYPHEKGTLCSSCFYRHVCTPGPDTHVEPDAHDPTAAAHEPTSLERRRARRGF